METYNYRRNGTKEGDSNVVCISVATGLFITGILAYIVIIVIILAQLCQHKSIHNVFELWPTLSPWEYFIIMALPWMVLLAEIIWLRGIWKPRKKLEDSRIFYDALPHDNIQKSRIDRRRSSSHIMKPSRTRFDSLSRSLPSQRKRFESASRSLDYGTDTHNEQMRQVMEDSLIPKLKPLPATYQQIERESVESETSSFAAHPELENFMFELDYKIDNWAQKERLSSKGSDGDSEISNQEEVNVGRNGSLYYQNMSSINENDEENITSPYNPIDEIEQIAVTIQVPGEVAGQYSKNWLSTFDLTLVGLVLVTMLVILMIAWEFDAYFFIFCEFWLVQIPKILIIWGIFAMGGVLCRRYCPVDVDGYIITSRRSWFKINYVHKFCCLSVYLIPLLSRPSGLVGAMGMVCDLWVVLAALVVLIKPLRERVPLFMFMFNAVDRPEDRPHTLEWLVAGNIFPGFLVILLFQRLFMVTGQADLLYILVLSTGAGDGLSEPVGVYFGKHKYTVSSWNHRRRYQRTMEASACMLFVTMLVITLSWQTFKNAIQFFACQAIIPMLATSLEAIAPHPTDTPITMFASGFLLTLIISFL